MRREAVSTNWPTVALKPERNALKGWCKSVSLCYIVCSGSHMHGALRTGENRTGSDIHNCQQQHNKKTVQPPTKPKTP